MGAETFCELKCDKKDCKTKETRPASQGLDGWIKLEMIDKKTGQFFDEALICKPCAERIKGLIR